MKLTPSKDQLLVRLILLVKVVPFMSEVVLFPIYHDVIKIGNENSFV